MGKKRNRTSERLNYLQGKIGQKRAFSELGISRYQFTRIKAGKIKPPEHLRTQIYNNFRKHSYRELRRLGMPSKLAHDGQGKGDKSVRKQEGFIKFIQKTQEVSWHKAVKIAEKTIKKVKVAEAKNIEEQANRWRDAVKDLYKKMKNEVAEIEAKETAEVESWQE